MGGPGGGVEGEYDYYCGNLVFLFCMSFIVIQVILLLDGTNDMIGVNIKLVLSVVKRVRPNGE